MTELLLNPFEKYSELKLLITGLLLTAAGTFLAYLFGGTYDGVIDFHLRKDVNLFEVFADNGISILCLVIFLFIAGRIVNTKTRFIDVLNTTLIARAPFYLMPFSNINGFIDRITGKIDPTQPEVLNLSALELSALIFFGFLSIALLVWFVVLLYNGYKTASNAKSAQHKIYFAVAIVLAEILSKYLFTITSY